MANQKSKIVLQLEARARTWIKKCDTLQEELDRERVQNHKMIRDLKLEIQALKHMLYSEAEDSAYDCLDCVFRDADAESELCMTCGDAGVSHFQLRESY